MPDYSKFYEARSIITKILKDDLIGPVSGNEILTELPTQYYIMGKLYPQGTEGEIIDAIRRPLGAKSLDGVKRRTRAGMGRCQLGFCAPKVMEILARELEKSMEEITKSGGNSRIIEGINKDIF